MTTTRVERWAVNLVLVVSFVFVVWAFWEATA